MYIIKTQSLFKIIELYICMYKKYRVKLINQIKKIKSILLYTSILLFWENTFLTLLVEIIYFSLLKLVKYQRYIKHDVHTFLTKKGSNLFYINVMVQKIFLKKLSTSELF